jgi:hypothetical protein
MSTRKATQEEQEVLEYLNALRMSGATNMFGAAPYIQEEFGLNRMEAKNLLLLWMKNFNEEGNYETLKTA